VVEDYITQFENTDEEDAEDYVNYYTVRAESGPAGAQRRVVISLLEMRKTDRLPSNSV
jgi:hypothetical protein